MPPIPPSAECRDGTASPEAKGWACTMCGSWLPLDGETRDTPTEGNTMNVNVIVLVDTLAATPEARYSPSGAQEIACRLKLVEHGNEGQEFSTYIPFSAYGRSGDTLIVPLWDRQPVPSSVGLWDRKME